MDGLIEAIAFVGILYALVEMQQQALNARVRVDVDPVALRQDVVILSGVGFPSGRCVTGLWVMLRIYAWRVQKGNELKIF